MKSSGLSDSVGEVEPAVVPPDGDGRRRLCFVDYHKPSLAPLCFLAIPLAAAFIPIVAREPPQDLPRLLCLGAVFSILFSACYGWYAIRSWYRLEVYETMIGKKWRFRQGVYIRIDQCRIVSESVLLQRLVLSEPGGNRICIDYSVARLQPILTLLLREMPKGRERAFIAGIADAQKALAVLCLATELVIAVAFSPFGLLFGSKAVFAEVVIVFVALGALVCILCSLKKVRVHKEHVTIDGVLSSEKLSCRQVAEVSVKYEETRCLLWRLLQPTVCMRLASGKEHSLNGVFPSPLEFARLIGASCDHGLGDTTSVAVCRR